MKNLHLQFLLLLVLITFSACDSDDDDCDLDCSTPSYISMSDYSENPTEVEISWGIAPNADEYLLAHYINENLDQTYATQALSQRVAIDVTTIQQHRFNIFSKCDDNYLQALNIHFDVPSGVSANCSPPTNVEITSITDEFITFEWEAVPEALSYTIYDYSYTPPLAYPPITTNFTTVPLNPDFESTEFGFVSNCSNGSSISYIICVATAIDIDSMLGCDKDFYCQLAQRASEVYVREDDFRGSVQDAWNRYCPNKGTYPCTFKLSEIN